MKDRTGEMVASLASTDRVVVSSLTTHHSSLSPLIYPALTVSPQFGLRQDPSPKADSVPLK